MYLSATNEKLQIVLSGAVNTNQLQFTASFNDVTSAGITLPQSSNQGVTNNTTDVDMVAAPAASTTRQVMGISVYNADVATAEVTIKKDVAGTEYILTKQTLNPGDTLFYTWGGGWNVLPGTGSSENITFSVFTSSGTYTKPQGLKFAFICCLGGGGGAGSGRQGASGEGRSGGGGGGGGAMAGLLLPSSAIAPTVSVTVGVGGTGGAAQTATSTSGVNGNAGGNTSFGGLVVAVGGSAGGGGGTTSGNGGSGGAASSCTPPYGQYALSGAAGSSGVPTTSSTGGNGLSGTSGGAAGTGGAGINTSNTSASSAGAGGGVYQNGVLVAGPAAGSAGAGSDNQSVFLHFSQTLSSGYGLGTGGAGGFPSSGKYDGGNGGNYGAGAGGGSGSLNGTNSGKGGNGGGGLCVVMNIF